MKCLLAGGGSFATDSRGHVISSGRPSGKAYGGQNPQVLAITSARLIPVTKFDGVIVETSPTMAKPRHDISDYVTHCQNTDTVILSKMLSGFVLGSYQEGEQNDKGVTLL